MAFCANHAFISGFSRSPLSHNAHSRLTARNRSVTEAQPTTEIWRFLLKKGSWPFLGKRLGVRSKTESPSWNRSELFTSCPVRRCCQVRKYLKFEASNSCWSEKSWGNFEVGFPPSVGSSRIQVCRVGKLFKRSRYHKKIKFSSSCKVFMAAHLNSRHQFIWCSGWTISLGKLSAHPSSDPCINNYSVTCFSIALW